MCTSEQKFQTDSEYRLHRLKHFAKKYKWSVKRMDMGILELSKERAVLLIDVEDLRITTCLDHPKYGSTILVRKGKFTQLIIESIFRNPRQHMNKKINSRYL